MNIKYTEYTESSSKECGRCGRIAGKKYICNYDNSVLCNGCYLKVEKKIKLMELEKLKRANNGNS